MSFHRTHILGNLGDDPEVKIGPTGTARTTFRVAVNDRWTGTDGQAKEHVEWYRIICFGRLAETVAPSSCWTYALTTDGPIIC